MTASGHGPPRNCSEMRLACPSTKALICSQRVGRPAEVHRHVALRALDDVVGEVLPELLHHPARVLAPDEPLGAVDGVLRVHHHLVLGHLADQEVALLAQRHHRRQHEVAPVGGHHLRECGCAPRPPGCWWSRGRSRRCAASRPWGSSPRLYAGDRYPPTGAPGGFLDDRPPDGHHAPLPCPASSPPVPFSCAPRAPPRAQVSPRPPSPRSRRRGTRQPVSRPDGAWWPPPADSSVRPRSSWSGQTLPGRLQRARARGVRQRRSAAHRLRPPGRQRRHRGMAVDLGQGTTLPHRSPRPRRPGLLSRHL